MSAKPTAGLRAIVRDLVVDVRCAERDGMPEYAARCRTLIARCYAERHTTRLTRYGYVAFDEKSGR